MHCGKGYTQEKKDCKAQSVKTSTPPHYIPRNKIPPSLKLHKRKPQTIGTLEYVHSCDLLLFRHILIFSIVSLY